MDYAFNLLRQTRKNISDLIKGLAPDQVQKQPSGFSNHILWNAGHVLASQQLLTYALAKLPIRLDQTLVDTYRKGTFPGAPVGPEEVERLLVLLLESPDWLEEDYRAGLFQSISPYTSSYGIRLSTPEEAIQFNNVHEGLHLGYMMAIRKAL